MTTTTITTTTTTMFTTTTSSSITTTTTQKATTCLTTTTTEFSPSTLVTTKDSIATSSSTRSCSLDCTNGVCILGINEIYDFCECNINFIFNNRLGKCEAMPDFPTRPPVTVSTSMMEKIAPTMATGF